MGHLVRLGGLISTKWSISIWSFWNTELKPDWGSSEPQSGREGQMWFSEIGRSWNLPVCCSAQLLVGLCWVTEGGQWSPVGSNPFLNKDRHFMSKAGWPSSGLLLPSLLGSCCSECRRHQPQPCGKPYLERESQHWDSRSLIHWLIQHPLDTHVGLGTRDIEMDSVTGQRDAMTTHKRNKEQDSCYFILPSQFASPCT